MRSTQTRTFETFWSAIGSLLDRFAPNECERCIAIAAIASQGNSALAFKLENLFKTPFTQLNAVLRAGSISALGANERF